MEELIVLGTGNATVTRCFNTCFALRQGQEYLLVDAGGGNGILRALEDQKIPLTHIHHLFVTHAHSDHLLGIPWIIRMIGTAMNKGTYEGSLNIYCHRELADAIRTITQLTVQAKVCRHFDERILFHIVEDQSRLDILGSTFTFLDIQSTKAKQTGFLCTDPSGLRLAFPGDEPCPDFLFDTFRNAHWMFHEAFCLYEDRDRFQPYEKHHSTVKDACQLAQKLQIQNLILWHTEDKDLPHRRKRYETEGKAFFTGRLYIPADGEHFLLGDPAFSPLPSPLFS